MAQKTTVRHHFPRDSISLQAATHNRRARHWKRAPHASAPLSQRPLSPSVQEIDFAGIRVIEKPELDL